MNRRITDNWKVEAEARLFSNVEPGSLEYDLRGDDYLQLEVRRYFNLLTCILTAACRGGHFRFVLY